MHASSLCCEGVNRTSQMVGLEMCFDMSEAIVNRYTPPPKTGVGGCAEWFEVHSFHCCLPLSPDNVLYSCTCMCIWGGGGGGGVPRPSSFK